MTSEEQFNDHDRVLLMWPRLSALEDMSKQLQARQDRLEDRLDGLRAEMAATREQLSAKLDDGLQTLRDETNQHLGGIENHLTAQDETLTVVREKLAGKKQPWPDSAKAIVRASLAVIGSLIILGITALYNHW